MSRKVKLSFEFFPTRTPDSREKQRLAREQLKQFHPDFVSCTYGAGGLTRDGTLEAVSDALAEGHNVAPHISCIGMSKNDLAGMIDRYKAMGVKRLVALRGDVPSGMWLGDPGDFAHADEFVAFIREGHGDHFRIYVAAHPEVHPQARSARDDLVHFARKCAAGADAAITQYFYNTDAYERFVEDAAALGVNIPIYPGVMPITGFGKLMRFSESCGAEIPRWLRLKLQGYADDTASIKALGLDVAARMCERLIALGAPGLHFYTLNRAGVVSTLCQRLGF